MIDNVSDTPGSGTKDKGWNANFQCGDFCHESGMKKRVDSAEIGNIM